MTKDHYKVYIKNTVIVLSVIIAVIIISYISNFAGSSLSKDSSNWGTFGDFIGGLLNPIIGIANIIILILISYQIAGWDNERHKKEFLHKCYSEISELLGKYKLSKTSSTEMEALISFLVSFQTNQQYLFDLDAKIVFNERMSALQSVAHRLKDELILSEKQHVINKPHDVSDFPELIPFLKATLHDSQKTILNKEFEMEKNLLIGFLQRILSNSDFTSYSQAEIIKHDGKDRSISENKPRDKEDIEA